MPKSIQKHIKSLESMKKYPSPLFYKGDIGLLERPKVSIVGSRRPSGYTREFTYKLSKELSLRGVCIISGAAMGVDAVAHEGAGYSNTIAVVANGLDIRYPAINKNIIEKIESEGLVLSQFEDGFCATGWSFVVRNELVAALGDILIVAEADLDSGSMRSAEYALKMDKKIYVLPHRLSESLGTQSLLNEQKATVIADMESFVAGFGMVNKNCMEKDEFFYFCQKCPTFDEALHQFGDKVYEAELDGLIAIDNGIVRLN